jgi:thiol-disulfide isomerase/thioredoxin
MRQLFLAAIPLSLILWGPTPETRPQDDGVQLHVVKYEGLKETVLKNRGKVVVVDVWADFCIPCKKNMPHLVELAQKYSGKGLAVITVSIDQWRQEPDAKKRVLDFLKKRKATCTNLLLDETPPVVEQKLHFKTIPTVFVFDRRGQWVQFTDNVDPHEVEKLVVSLLKE